MASRREVLRVFGLFVAAGLVKPAFAQSSSPWNEQAFASKTFQDVAKAYGGAAPAPTKDVSWGSTPEIAENGAVVPISVTSRLPGTVSIAILVEKNPNALAGKFDFPAGTEPTVSTRVKIAQSSDVHALIRTADGKFHVATREVKVTLGGCGG